MANNLVFLFYSRWNSVHIMSEDWGNFYIFPPIKQTSHILISSRSETCARTRINSLLPSFYTGWKEAEDFYGSSLYGWLYSVLFFSSSSCFLTKVCRTIPQQIVENILEEFNSSYNSSQWEKKKYNSLVVFTCLPRNYDERQFFVSQTSFLSHFLTKFFFSYRRSVYQMFSTNSNIPALSCGWMNVLTKLVYM